MIKMIRIIIYKNSTNDITLISSEGHAGYSEEGQDIICAGVSALLINTINSIEYLTDDTFYIENDDSEAGLLKVRFLEKLSNKGNLLLESFILGIKGIENDYGTDYIKLSFKEV